MVAWPLNSKKLNIDTSNIFFSFTNTDIFVISDKSVATSDISDDQRWSYSKGMNLRNIFYQFKYSECDTAKNDNSDQITVSLKHDICQVCL